MYLAGRLSRELASARGSRGDLASGPRGRAQPGPRPSRRVRCLAGISPVGDLGRSECGAVLGATGALLGNESVSRYDERRRGGVPGRRTVACLARLLRVDSGRDLPRDREEWGVGAGPSRSPFEPSEELSHDGAGPLAPGGGCRSRRAREAKR